MWKINCKGKRTVGKANKGINVEKIIGLKIKIKKREKLHRTSKAQCKSREVCNNNKKCDWGKRIKKKLRSLIGFLSANWISTNWQQQQRGRKRKRNPKESTKQVKK